MLDNYSFDIAPITHYYITCTRENTNVTFTQNQKISNALVEMW